MWRLLRLDHVLVDQGEAFAGLGDELRIAFLMGLLRQPVGDVRQEQKPVQDQACWANSGSPEICGITVFAVSSAHSSRSSSRSFGGVARARGEPLQS